MNDPATILEILQSPGTVAVVGLSPKAWRASFEIAMYLQHHGWKVLPINPNADRILGEQVYPTLAEAAKAHPAIDVVNVFRNSEDVPPVADEAIAIGAKALWLQLGIAHDVAAQKAEAAGLQVVQNRCIKTEIARARARGQL